MQVQLLQNNTKNALKLSIVKAKHLTQQLIDL